MLHSIPKNKNIIVDAKKLDQWANHDIIGRILGKRLDKTQPIGDADLFAAKKKLNFHAKPGNYRVAENIQRMGAPEKETGVLARGVELLQGHRLRDMRKEIAQVGKYSKREAFKPSLARYQDELSREQLKHRIANVAVYGGIPITAYQAQKRLPTAEPSEKIAALIPKLKHWWNVSSDKTTAFFRRNITGEQTSYTSQANRNIKRESERQTKHYAKNYAKGSERAFKEGGQEGLNNFQKAQSGTGPINQGVRDLINNQKDKSGYFSARKRQNSWKDVRGRSDIDINLQQAAEQAAKQDRSTIRKGNAIIGGTGVLATGAGLTAWDRKLTNERVQRVYNPNYR